MSCSRRAWLVIHATCSVALWHCMSPCCWTFGLDIFYQMKPDLAGLYNANLVQHLQPQMPLLVYQSKLNLWRANTVGVKPNQWTVLLELWTWQKKICRTSMRPTVKQKGIVRCILKCPQMIQAAALPAPQPMRSLCNRSMLWTGKHEIVMSQCTNTRRAEFCTGQTKPLGC